MAEQERTAHTEDLPLEGTEAESIVGGHMSPTQISRADQEIARLEKEGYVQDACTVEGTLMVNPHTHKSVTVRL
jgi:hypothetical protein